MNARIEIRDVPSNTPPAFRNRNGTLTLDLGENFTFALTKAATEGNEVNAIKREGTSSFSVPITDKNVWILRKWLFPNNHAKDFSRIRVHAFDGPHVLAEDRLDVLQVNFSDNTIEIGLFESPENGVADGANSLLINTIDFGTFELTEANLETNWTEALWEDGVTADFYFPLIHYGNFIVDQYAVSVEDFRPLLSIPATLKRGFCAIGWAFDTPLMQTEWFRRLWWYGLGKEYFRHSDWGRLARVDVQYSAQVETTGGPPVDYPFAFDTENEDIGNAHAISGGQSEFTKIQSGNLRYHIFGQIDNFIPFDHTINITIATEFEPAWKVYQFAFVGGEVKDIDIEFTEEIYVGGIVKISMQSSVAMRINAGFRVTIEPREAYYYKGDIIAIQESIDAHYTFLQFLQGLLHFGFRFDINHGTKTVTMYATEQANIFGEGVIEGYYRPAYDAEDLTGITQHKSGVLSFPKEDTPEALIIGFRKSTDKYIESLEIPEDDPIYSKRLEFPTGTKDLIEYSENPFFEPTGNYQWFGVNAPQINTPAMWDNAGALRSFEIAPRILYAAGRIEQSRTVDGVTSFSEWSYEGANRQSLPYAFQVPGALVSYPPAYPTGYFVYDDPVFSTYSLWAMWLKRDNRFHKNLPTIEVLMQLSSQDYHTFSFRDRVEINLLGRPTILKAIAIKDYQTEAPIATPVVLQIDPDECA